MKAFEIKRLMVVALVACLPIACGSSLPTGIDVAALDGGATASALRSAPGVPPTAPEAPSPESVPVPEVPETGSPTDGGFAMPGDDAGSVPNPQPNDDSGSVPVPPSDDDTGSVPAPSNGPNTDPPSTDPLPDTGSVPVVPSDDDTGSVPAPPPADDTGSAPAPAPADPGTVPGPPVRPLPTPNAPPTGVPPPPQPAPEQDDAGVCNAVSAEIMILRGSLPLPLREESVLLEIVMLGKDGILIEDGSCKGVAWSFDNSGSAAGPTITVSADTRYATVAGLAGAYTIRATTPNDVTATVAITVQ